MDNANKILERIKSEKIDPTPGWVFKSRNMLTWAGFILAVLLGALSFSVILFAIQQTDFNLIGHLSHSGVEMFLALLPMIWLFSVLIFLSLAMLSIRYSWKGYKFTLFKLVSLSVLMSVTLGTLVFIAGGGQKLEQAFNVNFTSYESIEDRKIQIWSNPAEGFLSGSIISVGEDHMVIEDFKDKQWQLEITDAFIAPVLLLEPGEIIKITGKRLDDNQFRADEIRPWGGPGLRQGQGFGQGRRNRGQGRE